MTVRKKIILPLTIITPFIVAPLLVDTWISERDRYYQQLRDAYECIASNCQGDFDGDGSEGSIVVQEETPKSFLYQMILIDGGRELIRLPYQYSDDTLRTHTAIRTESGKARFLVFDAITHAPPLRTALVWDGREMSQANPSEIDNDILAAMAAHEDSGTFRNWVLYKVLRLPFLTHLLRFACS